MVTLTRLSAAFEAQMEDVNVMTKSGRQDADYIVDFRLPYGVGSRSVASSVRVRGDVVISGSIRYASLFKTYNAPRAEIRINDDPVAAANDARERFREVVEATGLPPAGRVQTQIVATGTEFDLPVDEIRALSEGDGPLSSEVIRTNPVESGVAWLRVHAELGALNPHVDLKASRDDGADEYAEWPLHSFLDFAEESARRYAEEFPRTVGG